MTLREFRRMPVADVLPLLSLLEAEAEFRLWQAVPLQAPSGTSDGGISDGE